MKPTDINPCAICGKRVANDTVTPFYRVRLQPFHMDAQALWQQAVGAPMTDQIAIEIGDERTALICQPCSTKPQLLLQIEEIDA